MWKKLLINIMTSHIIIIYLLVGNPRESICQTISGLDSLTVASSKLRPTRITIKNDTLTVIRLCKAGEGKDKFGRFIGKFESCIRYLEQAEKISIRLNWDRGMLMANLYAGNWYGWKGQDLKGLQKKQRAIYYAEKTKDSYYLSYCYRLMADSYLKLGSINQAINFYKKSLIPSKKASMRNYLICEENIGLAYLKSLEFNQAKYWLLKCIKDSENEPQIKKYAILYLSEVYLELKDSKGLFKQLAEYDKIKFEDPSFDVRYYTIKAKAHILNKEYSKALNESFKGAKLSASASGDNQMGLYENIYKLYEKLGNQQLAFRYYKKFTFLKGNDIEVSKRRQIDLIRYEYDNRIQKDKIETLNTRINLQGEENKMLFLGFIIFTIFSAILFLNGRALKYKSKQIEKQHNKLTMLGDQLLEKNQILVNFNLNLENVVKERTLELTEANENLLRKNRAIQEAYLNGKSQERKRVASELHDNLGSTLSGLVWQLESIDVENLSNKEKKLYLKSIGKIKEAYEEVRYISHNLIPSDLNKGLMNAISKLVSELNFMGRIEFNIAGEYPDNKFSKTDEAELYSILLELINNILKHSDASKCKINMQSFQKEFTIAVEDNGKGFNPEDQPKRGRGLNNIRERIMLLKGILEINAAVGKGATFKIIIPTNNFNLMAK